MSPSVVHAYDRRNSVIWWLCEKYGSHIIHWGLIGKLVSLRTFRAQERLCTIIIEGDMDKGKLEIYINFRHRLWKKYTSGHTEFFCGTRYRSSAFKTYFILHVSSKRKKCCKTEDSTFLWRKLEKNGQTSLPSQNYPGPPLHPKVMVSVLKCAQHLYIFSQYAIFKKTYSKKSYCEKTFYRANLAPP